MGGVGQIHWYSFRRHTSHASGDGFTAAKVFHQHANTDVPRWVTMIYHPNNRNAYNQVTPLTHLNFNWGMPAGCIFRFRFRLRKSLLLPIQQMKNITNKYDSKHNRYTLRKIHVSNSIQPLRSPKHLRNVLCMGTCPGYPGNFQEPHWRSRGLPGKIQDNLTPLLL